MGQKVNPNGFRVGVNKNWSSEWTASDKDFAKFVKEDDVIRKFIVKKYADCAISKVGITRTASKTIITICTGRPAILIGQKGAGVDAIKKELVKLVKHDITINIVEVKNVDLDANLVAQSVASQIEKRVSWRRAMKMAISRAMKAGAKGVKVMVGGRLDGAEIARSEHSQEGGLPLQTLRSNIDYAKVNAHTTSGVIGVKVWIYLGEILTTGVFEPINSTENNGRNNRAQQHNNRPARKEGKTNVNA